MTLLRLFLPAIIILTLGACAAIERHVETPTVVLKQITYKHISLQEGVLDSQVQLTNSNSFEIPVRNVTYYLKINDRDVASSQVQLDRNIPANGSIEFNLPITIRYPELLEGISAVITQKKMRFQLRGEIDFGLVIVPYQKTGEFYLQ